MAKIIAITNQKGGVGKTTTSINLSAALAKMNCRVLLVDSDPQGNATGGLGINKSTLHQTIYDVLINGTAAKYVLQQTNFGVTVLPSNINLAGAEVELVSAMARENKLKNALALIRDEFDFIIIDCPPSLGLLTVNALNAADSVIIPIQCEFYALEGVSQLMKTIEIVRSNLNPILKIEGIVMTMFDVRTNLSRQVAEEVKKIFADYLYETIIPRSIKLSEAPGFGKPVTDYAPTSKSAEFYMNLAKEVIERGK